MFAGLLLKVANMSFLHRWLYPKQVLLTTWQDSQENGCVEGFFNNVAGFQPANLEKKDSSTIVFQ